MIHHQPEVNLPQNMDKYIPGQCNIGKYEAQKRLNIGIFGMIVAIGFSFIFYVIMFDKFIVFIVLFSSLFSGILGFLQYYNKFCVYYGILQVFNFENIKNLTKVNNLNDIQKDKQKALKLILISSIIALIYSVIYIIITN